MKTKLIIAGVAVALFLSVTFTLKSNMRTVEGKIYRPDIHRKVLVQAFTVAAKDLDKTFSYTGTFAPFREVMIIPQVNGEVKGIYFQEGDQVQQGKKLLQIDDDLLQAQYEAAKASYEISSRNYERNVNASQSGGVSKLQLDNYRLSWTNAESQLKQLEKQIRMSRIEAPFAGTITMKDVEIGAVVSRSAIARITDMSQLKLEISVPENEIELFQEGETAAVSSDLYPDKTFKGQIDYVSDRGDEAHNYTVKILIRNDRHGVALKAGMYGTVSVSKGLSKKTLTIPRAALLGSAKNPQVFVVKGDTAVLMNIQTGKTTGEAVEVIQGLQANDVVVTTGHINLSSGSKVQVAKN